MIKKHTQKLTLYQPETYQIKVPGELGESWPDWIGRVAITVDSEGAGPPVVILTGIR